METYIAPSGFPLDARASEITYVKRLAQFLAHGRHRIHGASIIIVIAPVSSGEGPPGGRAVFLNHSTLMFGPASFPDWGAVLCVTEHLAVPLASTQGMPVTPLSHL